jgi:TPR repeat protein
MKRLDNDQKVSLLMEEAARGDARAQRLLALRYWRGRGVMQNNELAAQWMLQAAAQKLALAERDLAGFYQQGIGVARDPDEALRLYRLAARQGDPIAKKIIREIIENPSSEITQPRTKAD